MNPYFVVVCVSLFAILASNSAAAQGLSDPTRFAVGFGVGTNGAIVEGSYKLSGNFVLRGQGAFIDFNDSFKSNDVKYSGRFHANTGGGFVDWHPLSSPWLVSAGAVAGERRVNLRATPSVTGSITIHGQSFPITEVGEVDGKVELGSPAPFVGFGWDNTFYTANKLGLRAVIGVIFGDGDPAVSLHAVGPFASAPSVASDVAAEQVSLQHDVRDFRYYPVVQMGLNYRF